MARLNKEIEQRKIEILDEVSDELKEKSTVKNNLYTKAKLYTIGNERLKLEGITQISPTSIRGSKPAKYLEKYIDDIEKFEENLKESKTKSNNRLYNRISDLEEQVQNLAAEVVLHRDNYMLLERNYEQLREQYEYQKSQKNKIVQKYELLQKDIK